MSKPTRPYNHRDLTDEGCRHHYPTNRALRFLVKCKRRANELDAIAVFTFFLVIVGAIQVSTYIATERSFLSEADIQFFNGPFLPPVGTQLTIIVSVQNSGKTTAFITNANIMAKGLPRGTNLPSTPEYLRGPNDIMRLSGPIVAGGTVKATFRTKENGAPFILSDQVAKELNDGSEVLYVYGFITYHDSFELGIFSRTTGFCGVYNPLNSPDVGMFDRCGNAAYEYGD